ncbi:hypothetical protein K461DRAFT_291901 [Myriangium duriaei CBS 260.36]|uniref:Uncharacterized protein n=1 Tax=Myriangium duriaei CBS 260.36 TaxID=1168546 RepID=A0A9P4J6K6_9PEZI|nr:hypothetical protein K461DRAFT_291901 [Myriangium duriaei CBS 260.36]
MLLARRSALSAASLPHTATCRRGVATLSSNSHIYIHPQSDSTSLLSFLPTTPANPALAIGTTRKTPPTPDSLVENPNFLRILQSVIRQNATSDPAVVAQAQVYASNAGASLGSGGVFFPKNHPSQAHHRAKKRQYGGGGGAGGDGAGGASSQGGMGGAGRGGWIHVSDQRNPPDYGRVAWPEDIFGSLEVDGSGQFVDGGRYQESGTYRMVTREGILQLSDYLRAKLVERLQQLEAGRG